MSAGILAQRPTLSSSSTSSTVPTVRCRSPPIASVGCEEFATQAAKENSSWKTKEGCPMAAEAGSTPIVTSRDWTVDGLVEQGGKHFRPVTRVSAFDKSPDEIRRVVEDYERSGQPLIVQDLHKSKHWPADIFNVEWLLEHGVPSKLQDIIVRNCLDRRDREMSLRGYVDMSRAAAKYAVHGETERLYGKDAPCPKEWIERLKNPSLLPSHLLPDHVDNMLNVLTDSEPVETLMCYLGIGDTFTPAHKDLCASTGHNIMCYSEQGGSSFWFMTESSAANAATDLFHDLGYELDHEGLVATPETFKDAKFTVFVAEQKLGDFVLVPPRCCHQVVNHGGLTIKTSWSRMTVDGISTAFHYELPLYRRVCRFETYRIKQMCYKALVYYTDKCRDGLARCAEEMSANGGDSGKLSSSPPRCDYPKPDPSIVSASAFTLAELKSNVARLEKLVLCFDKILKEEYCFGNVSIEELSKMRGDSEDANSGGLSCDFCGADIFHTFFECETKECVAPSTQPIANSDVMGSSSAAIQKADSTTSDSVASNLIIPADKEDEESIVIPPTPTPPPMEEPDLVVICSPCFASGRTCGCGHMLPRRRLKMSALLGAQHDAVEVVDQYRKLPNQRSNTSVPVRWHPKCARSIEHPAFFDSALAVLKRQKEVMSKAGASEYTCSFPGSVTQEGFSHFVPAMFAVHCETCKRRLCMQHLLGRGIHSTDVFNSTRDNPVAEAWHTFHMRRAKIFESRMAELKKRESSGEPCEVKFYLIELAQKYGSCSPLRLNACQLGWYDKFMYFDPRLMEELPIHEPATDAPVVEKTVTKASVKMLQHRAEVCLPVLSEKEKEKYRLLKNEKHMPPPPCFDKETVTSDLASLYNRAATVEATSRPRPAVNLPKRAATEARTYSVFVTTADAVASLFTEAERTAAAMPVKAASSSNSETNEKNDRVEVEGNEDSNEERDMSLESSSDSESSLTSCDSDDEPLVPFPQPLRSDGPATTSGTQESEAVPPRSDERAIDSQAGDESDSSDTSAVTKVVNRIERVGPPRNKPKALAPAQVTTREKTSDASVTQSTNPKPIFRNYSKTPQPTSSGAATASVGPSNIVTRPVRGADRAKSSSPPASPSTVPQKRRASTTDKKTAKITKITPVVPRIYKDSDSNPLNFGQQPARKKARQSEVGTSKNAAAASSKPMDMTRSTSTEGVTPPPCNLQNLRFKKRQKETETRPLLAQSSAAGPRVGSVDSSDNANAPPAPRKETPRPAPHRMDLSVSTRVQPRFDVSPTSPASVRTTQTQSPVTSAGISERTSEVDFARLLHLLEQKLSYSGGGPSEVRDKLSHMEAMLQNLTKKIEKHEETMTRMENELRETQRGHTELFASNRAIESQVNKLTLSKEIADAVNLTQIRQNPSSSIVVQTNPSADPRAAGTATGAAHHESNSNDHDGALNGNNYALQQYQYHAPQPTQPPFYGTPRQFYPNKRPFEKAQPDGYRVPFARPGLKPWSQGGYVKRPRLQHNQTEGLILREEDPDEVRRHAPKAKWQYPSQSHEDYRQDDDRRGWRTNKEYDAFTREFRRDEGSSRDIVSPPPRSEERPSYRDDNEERSRPTRRRSRFDVRDRDPAALSYNRKPDDHDRRSIERDRSRSRSRHRSPSRVTDPDEDRQAVDRVQENRARTPPMDEPQPEPVPQTSGSFGQQSISEGYDLPHDATDPWRDAVGASARRIQR